MTPFKPYRCIIAGYTGKIGQQLTHNLLLSPLCKAVYAIGRRQLDLKDFSPNLTTSSQNKFHPYVINFENLQNELMNLKLKHFDSVNNYSQRSQDFSSTVSYRDSPSDNDRSVPSTPNIDNTNSYVNTSRPLNQNNNSTSALRTPENIFSKDISSSIQLEHFHENNKIKTQILNVRNPCNFFNETNIEFMSISQHETERHIISELATNHNVFSSPKSNSRDDIHKNLSEFNRFGQLQQQRSLSTQFQNNQNDIFSTKRKASNDNINSNFHNSNSIQTKDSQNTSELPIVAFCTLGARNPGSNWLSEIEKVDKDYIIQFGQMCKKIGVTHMNIVTTLDAHPKSFFKASSYKGEAIKAYEEMGFERLSIYKPCLVLPEKFEGGFSDYITYKLHPIISEILPLSYKHIFMKDFAQAIIVNTEMCNGNAIEYLKFIDFMNIIGKTVPQNEKMFFSKRTY